MHNINDYKLILDAGDSLDLSLTGVYEEQETKFLKEFIKPGWCVVDIGAHIGYYTIMLSKLVGESGKVYAFEPDKKNYQLLQKNIKLNNCNNIITYDCAIAEQNGKANLIISKTNSGGHMLEYSNRGIPIQTKTLDSFDIKPNFIKMDIEGSEYYAIQGMKETLKNNPTILIEFDAKLQRYPEEFFDLLKKYFDLFKITNKKLLNITEQPKEGINIFCIPKTILRD